MNNTFKQFLVLKGLRSVTVKGHVDDVRRLLGRIGTTNPTHEELSNFVAGLFLSDYSYSYKHSNIKTLEYWMEYIGNPITFGRQKKPKRLLKDTLTEAEINRIIYATRDEREKAIVMLLAYGGLRPKELCSVRIQDINFGLTTLRVEQGKGFQDGLVHLPSKCVEALMGHVSQLSRQQDDWLFKTYQGNQYNPCALRKFVKVTTKRAGLTKRVYPYLFRHSLAVNMAKRGAPLLQIKEHFRHKWIETTMWYLDSLSKQEKAERFFPQYV